jgi:RNA polymerase sigma-70 factor, ECF subfamily
MSAQSLRMSFSVAAAAADLPEDEETTVRAAARGDRAAFGELYSRHARVIYAILLARVPAHEAEDLVQEVFITAFQKLPGLRTPAAFRGWLCAIARNQVNDFHRSSRQVDSARKEAHAAPGHDKALIVLDAIRKLPEAYRETLILRLVEGMTGPEIALRTGLAPDSVRVNLFRGMKLLRLELSGEALR